MILHISTGGKSDGAIVGNISGVNADDNQGNIASGNTFNNERGKKSEMYAPHHTHHMKCAYCCDLCESCECIMIKLYYLNSFST